MLVCFPWIEPFLFAIGSGDCVHIGVSLDGGTQKKKKMMIFSKKYPMGLLGTTHHFRTPAYIKVSPFVESIYCVDHPLIIISFHSVCKDKPGWWQLKYLFFSPRTLGKISGRAYLFKGVGEKPPTRKKSFHPKSIPKGPGCGFLVFGTKDVARLGEWFFGRRWRLVPEKLGSNDLSLEKLVTVTVGWLGCCCFRMWEVFTHQALGWWWVCLKKSAFDKKWSTSLKTNNTWIPIVWRVHVLSVGSRALGSHRVHHGSLGDFPPVSRSSWLEECPKCGLKKRSVSRVRAEKAEQRQKEDKDHIASFVLISFVWLRGKSLPVGGSSFSIEGFQADKYNCGCWLWWLSF